jgi:hypothetical protein
VALVPAPFDQPRRTPSTAYWRTPLEGEAEPARVLGEDTLRRCRRVLGPDNRIALYLTQVASIT